MATPIGNLDDLSPRAVTALAAADTVVCEDTRRTGRLLKHAGIEGARLLAVHEHNEDTRVGAVLARLDAGEHVAVVTDAGMPGISDPGERLVRAAVEAGHRVDVVPGATAAVAGLVVSGLPAGRFCFEGFLPRRGAERTARLEALAREERTVVLFEAPHRLARTLGDLEAVLGAERLIAIARELTKLHEEVWRGTLAEAVGRVGEIEPRGEHVLVIAGDRPKPPSDEALETAVRARMDAGRSARDAAADVAAALGVARNRTYDIAVRLRGRSRS